MGAMHAENNKSGSLWRVRLVEICEASTKLAILAPEAFLRENKKNKQ